MNEKQIWYRWIYFAAMLIFGAILSFSIIPWQTPDETAHLQMIGEAVYNNDLLANLYDDLPLDAVRIRQNADEKISYRDLKEVMNDRPAYSKESCLPKGLSYKIIPHLPAAVGIELGIFLGLPTYWVLQLGEIFSLLWYAFACCYIIKLVPKKKELFAMVMILPMCMQQAASISYDAVLLPLCFLFTAQIYRIKTEEAVVGNRMILGLLVILLLIGWIKIPYLLLGGMLFLIPLNRFRITFGKHVFQIKKEQLKKAYCLCAVILIVLIIAARYILRDVFSIQIVLACARHPGQTVYLLWVTLKTWWKYILTSMIGQFGFLESALPFWLILLNLAVMVFVCFVNTEDGGDHSIRHSKADRMILLVIVVLTSVLITLSMIRHTYMIIYYGDENLEVALNYDEVIFNIPCIGGLQGRYYLPVLLPFLLALSDLFSGKKKIMDAFVCVIMVINIVMTTITVTGRYFG